MFFNPNWNEINTTGVSVLFLFQVLSMEEYFNEIEYQPDNSRILEYYYASQALYNDPVIVSFVIDEKVEYWNETELNLLESVSIHIQWFVR